MSTGNIAAPIHRCRLTEAYTVSKHIAEERSPRNFPGELSARNCWHWFSSKSDAEEKVLEQTSLKEKFDFLPRDENAAGVPLLYDLR